MGYHEKRSRSDSERILRTLFYSAIFVAVGYAAGRFINESAIRADESPRASTAPEVRVTDVPPAGDSPTAPATVRTGRNAPHARDAISSPQDSQVKTRERENAPSSRQRTARTERADVQPDIQQAARQRTRSVRAAKSEPTTLTTENRTSLRRIRSLVGVWRGEHTDHPARLAVTSQEGERLAGTITVRTGYRDLRIPVAGSFDSQTGSIRLEETGVSGGPRNAWDLGVNTGEVRGETMSGRGRDRRGRRYAWRFARDE